MTPQASTSRAIIRIGVGDPMVTSFNAGDVWQVDFVSDQPASPQQFFQLVWDLEETPSKMLSFEPIDQTHFRATLQWLASGTYKGPGKSKTIDGIKFTLVDSHPVSTPDSEKGLSTGAMFGIAAAGAVVVGGVIYLSTRKRTRRRRRR